VTRRRRADEVEDDELELDPDEDAIEDDDAPLVLPTSGKPPKYDSAPVNGELVEDVYHFEVGPGERRHRLDLYLHHVFKGRSRNYWKRMVEKDAVTVEGRPVKGSSRIGAGDKVAIRLEKLGRGGPRASGDSYQVLHEDDAILAVNKRAGAFCHPVGRLHNRSLVNDLRNDRGAAGAELRPCHRLDRFVSGLLLFAKTRGAAGNLGVQFEGRGVEKRYLALVHGLVEDDEGMIDRPLGKATNSVIRIAMGIDEQGKRAVTHYRVMERFAAPHPGFEGPDGAKDYSLVELEPETGRRHQLRLHLAVIGHPIVNDPLYGEVIDVDYFERQTFDNHDDPDDARRWIALHSKSLTFDHPLTGARTTIEAPPWGDFGDLLARLRAVHGEDGE
jgi:23S rRNA pseudouridine1911/1915/1917 synthase